MAFRYEVAFGDNAGVHRLSPVGEQDYGACVVVANALANSGSAPYGVAIVKDVDGARTLEYQWHGARGVLSREDVDV